MPYAVVDFETTGILPSYHHRVVEIGVTHVDDDGTITGRWETLINPQRDMGPQGIHGIRAVEILDAPTFADIAVDFAELLQGRVFTAHNAAFDLRFLQAEYERAGYWLDGGTPHVCTMALGSNFGLGASCSLSRACAHYGIDQIHAHSAGDDAFATARLLSAYRRVSSTWPGWDEYWEKAAAAGRAYAYPQGNRRGFAFKPRATASTEPPNFLVRISAQAVREEVEGAAAQYLALLDRCLLDGYVSVTEGAQLAEAAELLGLSRDAVDGLNGDYYGELVDRAWADGVLTDAEKADLVSVAELLRLPTEVVDGASSRSACSTTAEEPADRFILRTGDVIVLTGEMTRERSDWEAELRERGFVPHPTVTKKVALVVAADPDSLSGKAKKARDYGIPIVSETGLVKLLDR